MTGVVTKCIVTEADDVLIAHLSIYIVLLNEYNKEKMHVSPFKHLKFYALFQKKKKFKNLKFL